jgi:hypothetical protein
MNASGFFHMVGNHAAEVIWSKVDGSAVEMGAFKYDFVRRAVNDPEVELR